MAELINMIVSLEEALKYLPVVAKYHDRDVKDRIPVIFAMYAKYRDATLSFSPSGQIEGYSEASLEKDPLLKQLYIMSMEGLLEEQVRKDFRDLWASLQDVWLPSPQNGNAFYYLLCCYLVSGSKIENYAQASTAVMAEIRRILLTVGAKAVYELSGKAGLLGDDYGLWDSYAAFILDGRERFVDEFIRTINGDRPIGYLDENIFRPTSNGLSAGPFDAVVANLSVHGGIIREEDGYDGVCGFIDDMLGYYSDWPATKMPKVMLVVDADFCDAGICGPWREKLLSRGYVEGVSVVGKGGYSWAVLNLDLRGGHETVAFKGSDDTKGEYASFVVSLDRIWHTGGSLLPDDLLSNHAPGEVLEVAVVGNPFSDEEKEYLKRNHIRIAAVTDTILDEKNGLLRLLQDDAEHPFRKIHAVTVDAMAGYDEGHPFKYKGVADSLAIPSFGVPIFIFAGFPQDRLGEQLNYLLSLRKDEISFVETKGKGTSDIARLVKALRDSMGGGSLGDVAVMNRYPEEIAAADWLDSTGEVTRTIVSFLRNINAPAWQGRDPKDQLNSLRVCAEKIFLGDTARCLGLFPSLKLGEIQLLLKDGEFYDKRNGQFYILNDPNVMPAALCLGFKYFIDMTNGGSHSSAGKSDSVDVRGYMAASRRAGIYRACAFILLDLLIWFRNLCRNADGAQYSIRPLLSEKDIVQMVRVRDYYYIGNVHLVYKPGLREGLPASTIRLKTVGVEKGSGGDKVHVKYFSSDYDILPEKNSSFSTPNHS